jgi:hypothetical protein
LYTDSDGSCKHNNRNYRIVLTLNMFTPESVQVVHVHIKGSVQAIRDTRFQLREVTVTRSANGKQTIHPTLILDKGGYDFTIRAGDDFDFTGLISYRSGRVPSLGRIETLIVSHLAHSP